MLKIHCCADVSQRNVVSGVPEIGSSLMITPGADDCPMSLNGVTTPGVPIETPLASQTRNLAGTTLPCWKTLVPSGLIGWRMAWPGAPRQVVPAGAYWTLSVPATKTKL